MPPPTVNLGVEKDPGRQMGFCGGGALHCCARLPVERVEAVVIL